MTVTEYSKGEKRRCEILQIARQQLIDFGYDEFILRNIADQAKMRLSNLQYYFPTRDALLEAVIRAEADSDLEKLHALESKRKDPEQLLMAFCLALLEKWRGESGKVFSVMFFLATSKPAFLQIYTDIYNNFYAGLIPLIRDLDPHRSTAVYRKKAMLITAMIDGGAAQISKDKKFAKLIATQAVKIAVDNI